jgi:hypothetical protein
MTGPFHIDTFSCTEGFSRDNRTNDELDDHDDRDLEDEYHAALRL